MKKIYGLAALAAAMTLASCSNDNEPNVVSNDLTGVGYFKVNIKNPGVATKASHNNFVIGEDAENKAEKATFVFFDGSGNYMGIAKDVALDEVDKEASGNIEEKNTKIVEFTRKADKTNEDVKKVIAILNPTSAINSAVENQSESAILALPMAEYGSATSGSFIMTNSVYQSEETGKPMVYAQDCAGAIYNDYITAATATAKDIYVERVVARVDGTLATDFGTFKKEGDDLKMGAQVKVDGELTNVNVVPQGYEIHNAATVSHLIKNVDGFDTTAPFTGWSVAGNFRSHWANTSSLAANQYAHFKYKDIKTPAAANTNVSFTKYVQENTNEKANPILLMTAQLQTTDGTPLKLVQLLNNGLYYTEDNAKDALLSLLQTLGYQVKTETGTRDLDGDDLDWVANGVHDYDGYLGYAKDDSGKNIIGDADIVDKDGKAVENFEESVLKAQCGAYKWTDGKCYYYVDVKNGDEATDQKGIVRNHIYSINLNSVVGLGTPVFDPDNKTITPEKPEDPTPDSSKWYFNCTINILSWVSYTQNVNFD
ncbi:MAG: Mfa1 family fimbria major subunit [Muribaculaceae bacterium]|nr:Mfa1 family fimbria major subunit [Muribaculaceae bacterium]